MKHNFISGFLLVACISLQAQDGKQSVPFQTNSPIDKISIGLGVGLDYGGIGGNLSFYPVQSLGIFGGAGYALAGVGVNGGLKYRYIPKKPDARVRPYALAMYGYNAAIAVLNAYQYNKLFYGPTLGAGVDIMRKSMRRGYWSLAVLVPFRGDEVNDYIEDLENSHGADFSNSLLPVTITLGYKYIIHLMK
ncbi:MAG: hypothetical protein GY790_07760 [Bacteroidetes bacterium]|nr:hypothetical protein [Bacteroidota bacterium]